MSANLVALLYLVSGVLFIMASAAGWHLLKPRARAIALV